MLSAKLLLDTLSEYALISQLIRATTPEEVCRAAGEILQRPVEPSPGLFDLFLRIDEYDGVYERLPAEKRDAFVKFVRFLLVPFEDFRRGAAVRADGECAFADAGVKRKKPKRACAMAPYERPWSNVELIKDCGLIPYLLYKNHGMDCEMVGAPGGPYPYETLVEGLQFRFLPDGSIDTKKQFILEQGKEIDLLLLRGCYPSCYALAPLYKQVNPGGRIYIGLDANSSWMDRILFYDPAFQDFLDACDIIATSCMVMASHLSEKWGRKVLCLPNGYYSFSGAEDVSFSEK